MALLGWSLAVAVGSVLGSVMACDAAPVPESTNLTANAAAGTAAIAVKPTGAEVCKAFATLPVPPDVVTIAASATEGAIEPTADGTGMNAQVVELRAESGPVTNGKRRIDGITLVRELVLRNDGGGWSVVTERSSSRSEIFYVHKTPEHDPRKLFGAQIVERYGPKGGLPCELAR
ncbi:MAG: hypothetical protein IAG13_23985 [Deltaproteobacteria bacterium]|nr:hypothetical protein [Nannocystaceae bacterium]